MPISQASLSPAPHSRPGEERIGFLLVFLAALAWSLGGSIGRFLGETEAWTVVFWRSAWAAAFLVAFMLWRDGASGMASMFRRMGLPGLVVALCFATASTAFVVALSFTTVANILLMQAGAPLIAALLAFLFFRERISLATWCAIVVVILGVGIMVSDSLGSGVSPVGDGLALLIVTVFSIATVLTRRFAEVRMTPAVCLGTLMAAAFALPQAETLSVSAADMGFLFAFGAVNLGLGLALFSTGARLIPAAYAALLATFETLLGPVWVWMIHGEIPSQRTLLGGGIVFAALLVHIGFEFSRQMRPTRPGTSGVPLPD